MEYFQQLRRESLEYATLLWSLTETPGDPYMYEDKAMTQSSRQLSIVEERQLSDAFAFMASCKDDSDEIMAACIEERRVFDNGITIRIASNTGNPSDVVSKLQRVATTIMEASHRNASRTEFQQRLLGQVVEICGDRILSRLRSCHARRTRRTVGKPRLLPQLLEAVHRCVVDKQPRAITEKVIEQAQELSRIFELVEASLEGEPRKLRLMDLLQRVSQCDINSLSKVLLFDRNIDPSLRTHLPNAISKLARYVQISQYLINAARTKRHSLFQNMEVRAVRHPAFNPQLLVGQFRPFEDLFQELGWQKHQAIPEGRKSKSQYKSRVSDPGAIWKVHAEIQIVMFYEMEPQPVQPRFISASKLACFCCDLFIRSHGKFVVPGTHGRLYNTWVLPDLSERGARFYERLNPVMQHFISQLKLASGQNVARRGKRRSQPAESAVFSLEPGSSNSTIRQASPSPLSVFGEDKIPRKHLVIGSAASVDSVLGSSVARPPSTSAAVTDATVSFAISVEEECCQSSEALDSIISTVAPTICESVSFPNLDTVPSKKALQMLISSEESARVQTGALQLFLSVERANKEVRGDPSSGYETAFWINIEDISKSEREEVYKPEHAVFDLERMEEGRDYEVPVGVTASRRSIMLRNSTQRLLLTFVLPETIPRR